MSFRVTFISKNGDIMKSFILDFLSTWEKLLSWKTFAFQSLGGLAYENHLLFIANFSGFFDLPLSRQAYPLGWLLSLPSSGLSWGLVGLNGLCSLSFISHMLPWLPLSVGLDGGYLFVLGRIPHVQLWCSAHIFQWQCWISSWIYSAPLQPAFTQANKTFIQWQLGHFIEGTAF